MKSQRVDKEPTNLIDIENKIQDAQIKTIETHYFDADSKIKFKSQVPIKVKFFFVHHCFKKMFVIVKHFYF